MSYMVEFLVLEVKNLIFPISIPNKVPEHGIDTRCSESAELSDGWPKAVALRIRL